MLSHAPLTFGWGLTGWQLCGIHSGVLGVDRWVGLLGGWLGSVPLLSCFLLWAGLGLFTVSRLLRCRSCVCTGCLLRVKQTDEVKRCLSLTKASAGGGAMSLVKCGEPQQDEQDNKVMGSWRKKGLTSCSDSFLASCSAVPLSSAGPNRDSVFSAVHKRTSQKLCFSEYELFLNSHK